MLNPKYNRLRIQEILISISLFIDEHKEQKEQTEKKEGE